MQREPVQACDLVQIHVCKLRIVQSRLNLQVWASTCHADSGAHKFGHLFERLDSNRGVALQTVRRIERCLVTAAFSPICAVCSIEASERAQIVGDGCKVRYVGRGGQIQNQMLKFKPFPSAAHGF